VVRCILTHILSISDQMTAQETLFNEEGEEREVDIDDIDIEEEREEQPKP
jgi:ATP-binding cassette, subfamily B (MDR/TAP), member 7